MSGASDTPSEPTAPPAPATGPRRPSLSVWLLLAGVLVGLVAITLLALAARDLFADRSLAIIWGDPGRPDAGTVPRLELRPTVSSPEPTEAAAGNALVGQGKRLDHPDLDRYRDAGGLGDKDPGLVEIPRSDRWQMYFPEGLSEGPYARQLDALGVELAVVSGEGSILYVSQLSKNNPVRRTGKLADEKRLYLSWKRGDLLQADRTLLNNLGIGTTGKIILHFCPPQTEKQMADLERKYEDRDPKDVYLTRFALKQTFRGYRLFVMEQIPRD